MPTYTIYSESADGYLHSTGGTYTVNRAGTSGTINVDTTDATMNFGQDGADDGVYEAFISFDTTSVSGTVSSALLSLYGQNDDSSTDFTMTAAVRDWGASLTTGDYVAGASLAALTTVASLSTASFVEGDYFTLTNVAFPANVNKGGITRLILYSSRTSGNNNPSTSESVTVWTNEGGDGVQPRLVIVTSGGKPQRRRRPLFFQRRF